MPSILSSVLESLGQQKSTSKVLQCRKVLKGLPFKNMEELINMAPSNQIREAHKCQIYSQFSSTRNTSVALMLSSCQIKDLEEHCPHPGALTPTLIQFT